MSKSSISIKVNLILLLVGFLCLIGWAIITPVNAPESHKENEVLERIEIPAPIQDCKEQVINHMCYTVSYNPDWKIPNWVAYELTKDKVDGTVPRCNTFMRDPEVSYYQSASTLDYKDSEWDRGHMVPAGDMKWSEQAMKESFYLSNICPQNKNLNSGIWNDLEQQIRELARQKERIYIVCGPIVSKHPKRIGINKVAVPDAFFKVLLQNEDGEWSAIAFMFANESGRKPLSTYAMSVEDIQIITDIDFFPALPDSIEQRVEKSVDFVKWNIRPKR